MPPITYCCPSTCCSLSIPFISFFDRTIQTSFLPEPLSPPPSLFVCGFVLCVWCVCGVCGVCVCVVLCVCVCCVVCVVCVVLCCVCVCVAVQEDRLLYDVVMRLGARRWLDISAHIPGRNDKQCRSRWKNHVDPVSFDFNLFVSGSFGLSMTCFAGSVFVSFAGHPKGHVGSRRRRCDCCWRCSSWISLGGHCSASAWKVCLFECVHVPV